MNSKQWKMKTITGDLFLVASHLGLQNVGWKKQDVAMLSSLKGSEPESEILRAANTQLEEYFAGRRKSFDLLFDVQGTEFQQKVWDQLRRIPYGETLSYKDLARKIKNHKAVRAVGTANGRNPLGIIVPCHRVIAADGTLGGYAGGLDVKAKLLELERWGG